MARRWSATPLYTVGSELIGDTDGDAVGSEVVGDPDGEVSGPRWSATPTGMAMSLGPRLWVRQIVR